MSRFHSSIVALLLALTLLGCATERPTRPNAVIATLNLSDDIVLHTSMAISDTAYVVDSLDEIGLRVPDSLFAGHVGSHDVLITAASRQACGDLRTSVWSYEDSEWLVIRGNDAPRLCLGFVFESRVSLLPFTADVEGVFLGSAQILRIRGQFRRATVEVLALNPDYQPILVTVDSRNAIAECVGDGIASEFWTLHLGRGVVDSLVWFAFDGSRTRAAELPQRLYAQALLWTGSQLWTLTHGVTRQFGVVSDDGSYSPLFEFLPPQDSRSVYESAASWVEGRIWIPYVRQLEPGVNRMAMMVIDPEQSIAVGHAVFEEPLNLDSTLHTPFELTYHDGSVVMYTADHFARLSLNAEIIEELPLSVRPQSVTSDGEALWVIHNGPIGSHVDMPLLSRFTLE